jgi:lipopolysaccharide biosynthesis protein/ubiquinone/menaquinone biosynthesis C-methylase UbiE
LNRSAFRFPQPACNLPFDGERYVSGLLGDASSGDIQSEHYHRYLFAIQFCAGKDVLDIASGEGYGSFCLGQAAKSVIGVDANTAAVDFANRHYMNDRVSFKVGSAQSIPIADTSIDVVVSFETLEHFTEQEEFVGEVRRVLRPGGLLLISSPNRAVYSEEANYHNAWHLRELDRDQFTSLLTSAFSNVHVFAQRPIVGSVIAGDDALMAERPEGFILRGDGIFHRTEGVPHPPFYVAVASDVRLPGVQTSLLQNPALLQRLDVQRQEAVAGLESSMKERAALAAELDQVRASFDQALANLDQARADIAQAKLDQSSAKDEQARLITELAELRQARMDAEQEGLAVKSALEDGLAELHHVLDLSTRSAERVDKLRQELADARRRATELANEESVLRQHLAVAQVERDHYASLFQAINGSSLWKLTWPLRRVGSKLPAGLRRKLRRAARIPWGLVTRRPLLSSESNPIPDRTATPNLLPQVGPQRHAGVIPPLTLPRPTHGIDAFWPSERQRQHDANWIDPNQRPEVIRLRGLEPQAKIAAVVHVYYPDVWPELAEAITNIPEDFDLFVTLVADTAAGLQPAVKARFPDAHVLVVDNHGRDIFPLLMLSRAGVLSRYELICKVHSKRSPHRDAGSGDEWRKSLVSGMLGSSGLVARILAAFRSDPDLGLVVAPGQNFGGREVWISNEARAKQLFQKLGLNETAFERDFVGGSMFWIRPFIVDTIEALHLDYDDFEAEPIPPDGLTVHVVERLFSIICQDAGMRTVDSAELPSASSVTPVDNVHVIANYLPQFHPVPENDLWWGKGFTEWTNVTKAVPLFRGHRQPRLSTDLGFYDLRLQEARIAQADLARRHGVTAFSYYYYWFNGRKLLNRPIEEVVASGKPDFPFMICWANEPWTRNWDGLAQQILMPQDYSPGWERAFAADVAKIMHDPRYLRLNGKPMLAIYRIAHLPDKRASVSRLRSALKDEGIPEVHLIAGWLQLAPDEALPADARDLGLDAYFEFPPHEIPAQPLDVPEADRAEGFAALIYDYRATVDAVLDQLASSQTGFRYRGVMMGWDNTARRGANSFAFHGATPANFRRWLRAALLTAQSEARGSETAVFVNAWNEWAEGTYLEPDRDFGTGWLEAVASATDARKPRTCSTQAAVRDCTAPLAMVTSEAFP